MPNTDELSEFTAWCQSYTTVDEKSRAQIFLNRPFQAFGQAGSLNVGGTAEFHVRKADEAGDGIAFADCVWKSGLLLELKKRWVSPE